MTTHTDAARTGEAGLEMPASSATTSTLAPSRAGIAYNPSGRTVGTFRLSGGLAADRKVHPGEALSTPVHADLGNSGRRGQQRHIAGEAGGCLTTRSPTVATLRRVMGPAVVTGTVRENTREPIQAAAVAPRPRVAS